MTFSCDRRKPVRRPFFVFAETYASPLTPVRSRKSQKMAGQPGFAVRTR